MRRTTSRGNDLPLAALLPSGGASPQATPYVYMQAVPLSPTIDDTTFLRHCSGATVRVLHNSSAGAGFTLPDFNIECTDTSMVATGGDELMFSLPFACISRASIESATGKNLHLWSLLCTCCFGGRDKVLVLDIDAPVGWLQWGHSRGLSGVAGPVRLGLFVRDADEYVEALGIGPVLTGPSS